MQKLIYVSFADLSENHNLGVKKKIEGQLTAFEKAGFQCTLFSLQKNDVRQLEKKQANIIQGNDAETKMQKRKLLCKTVCNFALKNDVKSVYIRYQFSCPALIAMLRTLKENQCKVMIEIPTYPYTKELQAQGAKGYFKLCCDQIFCHSIKKYVDCIGTYSTDNTIYGVRTIQLVNGIDCDSISERTPNYNADEIQMLAVAGMSFAQGYDRLLEGLGDYYAKGHAEKVFLHLVGEGTESNRYHKIVNKRHIEQYVVFHGYQSGKNLNDICDMCNLAISSLGAHRKEIYVVSTLKSREYLAKGFPIVSSSKIDVLPKDYPYVIYVPEDETPINVNAIVDFYHAIYNQETAETVAKKIRNFATQTCDIYATMQPVANELLDV